MKKSVKIIFILFITILIQMTMVNVRATDTGFTIDGIISDGDSFLGAKDTSTEAISTESLNKTSKSVYRVLFSIGVALATIVGMIIGIQFMMGSPEEQAKVKETLVPYVVGVFVIFGAFGIWRIVINIGNEIEGPIVVTPPSTEDVRTETSDINQGIESGEIDINRLSNDELRELYRRNMIDSTLYSLVEDSRNPSRVSLETAINELGDVNRAVYNKCSEKGLLQENGIWLKQ